MIQILVNSNPFVTAYLYTDVMFLIYNFQSHHDSFNINNHIKYVTDNTRSALSNKLHHAD